MAKRSTAKPYVVCLSNKGYRASLVVRRIYRAIPDAEAEKRGLLRIIDESGEDYLFPESLFSAIELPRGLRTKLAEAT
jgi:hypothetical protein